MRWSKAPLIPLLCLMLSACDAQVEPDACPEKAAAGVSDYFPLAIGQTQTFDYALLEASPTTVRINGVLTWQVVSAGECAYGRQTFTVDETMTGEQRVTSLSGFDSTYQVIQNRTFMFVVDDSLIYPGPYFDRGLPRFQPNSAPDTLEFQSDDARSIYGTRGWRASVRLVRNKGLVSRSFFYHAGVSLDIYEDIILKEE